MGTSAVERLIQAGPLPLAEIAKRARNSLSATAKAEHACHYLAEAGAALGASFWLARVWAKQGALPQGVRRSLMTLQQKGAALGTWVELLRESARAFSDAGLASLQSPIEAGPAWDALAAEVRSLVANDNPFGERAGGILEELGKARRGGVLAALSFCVALRNCPAHTWMHSDEASRRIADLLLEAVAGALLARPLLDGHWIGRVQEMSLERGARQWIALRGLAHEYLLPDAPGIPDANAVPLGALHFVADAGALAAPGFLLEHVDATGLTKFGFFCKLIGRRTVEYVNHVSGGAFHNNAMLDSVHALFTALGAPVPENAEPPENLGPSQRYYGSFLVDEMQRLGAGANGEVYRAVQLPLKREVALKILPPSYAHDHVKLGRFNREVSALARCDHPNVVRIFDYGVREGRPYFAMDLVEGADLARVADVLRGWQQQSVLLSSVHLAAASSLRRPESPPAAAAGAAGAELSRAEPIHAALARLFAGAAEGIAELHRHGIVHRDIKPANLMLTAGAERLVVMDLGLAKTADQSQSLTAIEKPDFIGSVLYAAPEQIVGRQMPADFRATSIASAQSSMSS